MVMKIGAFRHALEEGAQRQRIGAHAFQLLGGALLGGSFRRPGSADSFGQS